MDRQKLRNILLVALPLIVVMLTMMPDSAQILRIAEDGVEEIAESCSGFSGALLENGNIGPMITGALCAMIALLSMVFLAKENKKLLRVVTGLSLAALVSSLLPVLMGVMTEIGWRIFALLDVEVALACEILFAFL